MFYKETKWLDEETQKLIDRREEIINELIDIEMKLDIIKGVSCHKCYGKKSQTQIDKYQMRNKQLENINNYE